MIAGTPVTVTARDDETEYAEVSDGQGKAGWVESRVLSDSVSRRTRLEEVERDLEKLQQTHAGSGAKLAGYEEELRRLKAQNVQLQSKNGVLESEIQRFRNELAALAEDQQMSGFRNNGW